MPLNKSIINSYIEMYQNKNPFKIITSYNINEVLQDHEYLLTFTLYKDSKIEFQLKRGTYGLKVYEKNKSLLEFDESVDALNEINPLILNLKKSLNLVI